MQTEKFKPISVKPPSSNLFFFKIRCWFDLQLRSIVKVLRPEMQSLDGHILDVGAGQSPWREWLPANAIYHGIDVGNAQEYGMKKNKDITYYDGKIMPFEKSTFDGAICIEVLEHVRDPVLFMSEISRVLKKNSTLLLSVPWSARRHHIPHDYHRFTKERLIILLEENGFSHIEIQERGDDIASIASKLIVVLIRIMKSINFKNAISNIPFALIIGPITFTMLIASHISEKFPLGAEEDPLGYFIKAKNNK